MTFRLTDEHIDQFHAHGYTIFEKVLPPSLIRDLRRVSGKAREVARAEGGPQIQRLQPVGAYDIDQQPFIDYAELPELVDAISTILTPRHRHGNRDVFGILFEPAERPWSTKWHRDERDTFEMDLSAFDKVFDHIDYFNQINCALYEDGSTWIVPGSHLRRDLPREVARFPERPIPEPNFSDKTLEEAEVLGLEYCRSLPGAFRLRLEPGDFALYRSILWYLGNYVPYAPRATLHDAADTPEFFAWRAKVREEMMRRREAGIPMENPNAPVSSAS